MCWEFPPQMALIISCDVINRDLVVKLYFFILYLNLCNIFRWENFVYGKDFYIERIYCQIKFYIYCHVFVAFLQISDLVFLFLYYLKLTETKFVCEQYTWNIHGTYDITVWAEYSTVQSSNKIQIIFYFYPRPLRECESTDGHFLLLLQLFPTSNFLFLPGWV